MAQFDLLRQIRAVVPEHREVALAALRIVVAADGLVHERLEALPADAPGGVVEFLLGELHEFGGGAEEGLVEKDAPAVRRRQTFVGEALQGGAGVLHLDLECHVLLARDRRAGARREVFDAGGERLQLRAHLFERRARPVHRDGLPREERGEPRVELRVERGVVAGLRHGVRELQRERGDLARATVALQRHFLQRRERLVHTLRARAVQEVLQLSGELELRVDRVAERLGGGIDLLPAEEALGLLPVEDAVLVGDERGGDLAPGEPGEGVERALRPLRDGGQRGALVRLHLDVGGGGLHRLRVDRLDGGLGGRREDRVEPLRERARVRLRLRRDFGLRLLRVQLLHTVRGDVVVDVLGVADSIRLENRLVSNWCESCLSTHSQLKG